jgi:hypothetical protein
MLVSHFRLESQARTWSIYPNTRTEPLNLNLILSQFQVVGKAEERLFTPQRFVSQTGVGQDEMVFSNHGRSFAQITGGVKKDFQTPQGSTF